MLLAERAEWVQLLVAVVGGGLGAILGMFAQRVAFSIGGLFAGGYLGRALAQMAGIPGEPLIWFAAGGMLGAIVAAIPWMAKRPRKARRLDACHIQKMGKELPHPIRSKLSCLQGRSIRLDIS